MGVGPHAGHMLKLFGAHIWQAFEHVPYQVGSSLTQKSGWRDVDVRLILPDDEFAHYFGNKDFADSIDHPTDLKKLTIWNLAWTSFGAQLTGLPIDFQIQSMTEANSEENNGPRSALLFTRGELFH